jgi:hypothetical protein
MNPVCCVSWESLDPSADRHMHTRARFKRFPTWVCRWSSRRLTFHLKKGRNDWEERIITVGIRDRSFVSILPQFKWFYQWWLQHCSLQLILSFKDYIAVLRVYDQPDPPIVRWVLKNHTLSWKIYWVMAGNGLMLSLICFTPSLFPTESFKSRRPVSEPPTRDLVHISIQ